MDKYQNAVEQIKKGIINYVNNVIRNAPMDKTYSGIITNINEDGTYDIKINNNKYSNINTIGGTCSINEVVKVLVPQNNYSRMFILKGGESGKKGTDNYSELENKPSINGVTLVGNKTTEDLNIVSGTDNYSELENKPSINGVTLVGNKTTEDLNIQVHSNWDEVGEKPFESINSEDFSVSDGIISVKEKDKEWDDISNKPFETINNDEFKIEDGELLLKDNVKEKSISWEDYKKLSDEEIHNGTNYYVYDYPYSGGGSISHVDFENYAELGTLKFGVDGDGNYGYYKADDSFIPFKSGIGEGIAFEVIGSLDESNAVSFEVPKDRIYLCVLKYTYAPNYHYIEIIPTVGNYGSRFITSNDYNTIIYNMGGYPLSSMLTSKTELEDSIKYTLTKDPSTKGIVELLYFPIDGSPIVPPSNGTIFDYVKEWGTPLTQSGSVVMNIVGANKIVSYWNGAIRIGAMMYSKYKIDLTSVKTISCKYFSTNMYGRGYYVHLYIHNTNELIEPINAVREVHSDTINEEVELVLDVEDMSGEYYLGIAPIGATCDIYDLKFEYL